MKSKGACCVPLNYMLFVIGFLSLRLHKNLWDCIFFNCSHRRYQCCFKGLVSGPIKCKQLTSGFNLE